MWWQCAEHCGLRTVYDDMNQDLHSVSSPHDNIMLNTKVSQPLCIMYCCFKLIRERHGRMAIEQSPYLCYLWIIHGIQALLHRRLELSWKILGKIHYLFDNLSNLVQLIGNVETPNLCQGGWGVPPPSRQRVQSRIGTGWAVKLECATSK